MCEEGGVGVCEIMSVLSPTLMIDNMVYSGI